VGSSAIEIGEWGWGLKIEIRVWGGVVSEELQE
jgi:hypothetical protein